MINKFLTYIEVERRYSPRTVEAYRDDLRDFCAFLGWEIAEFNPNDLDEDDVKGWVIKMLDDGASPRSVRRRLSSLHSFYKFLLRLDLVKRDITRMVIAPKVDKPLPVFFKPSEMERATAEEDAADDFESIRDCLIIEMLYQTGMRQAEMLGLKDSDVDLVQGQVRIFGKRSKERIVPIGEKLVEQIRRYLEVREEASGSSETSNTSGYSGYGFFIHVKADGEITPLTKSRLYSIVRARMGEVSTLKKHSPHVLRHTFATTMLNNGADIRTIQTLLGHSSLAATQVYTHTTFDQLKAAYQQAHPRSGKVSRK